MQADAEEKWITVASYLTPADADMMCMALEAADIPAQVVDEGVNRVLPFDRYALAAARIVVPESFGADALQVLKEAQPSPEGLGVRQQRSLSRLAISGTLLGVCVVGLLNWSNPLAAAVLAVLGVIFFAWFMREGALLRSDDAEDGS